MRSNNNIKTCFRFKLLKLKHIVATKLSWNNKYINT